MSYDLPTSSWIAVNWHSNDTNFVSFSFKANETKESRERGKARAKQEESERGEIKKPGWNVDFTKSKVSRTRGETCLIMNRTLNTIHRAEIEREFH